MKTLVQTYNINLHVLIYLNHLSIEPQKLLLFFLAVFNPVLMTNQYHPVISVYSVTIITIILTIHVSLALYYIHLVNVQ